MTFCKGRNGRATARVAPTKLLVGADAPVRPGPITQRLVGQGPCALPGSAGKIRVGPSRTPAPTKAYLVVRRGGVLPRPRATARVAPTEGYKRRGEVRNPPVTASPCQPPLGKGAEGTGDADCHTSDIGHWFAMTHYKKCGASPGGRTEASAPTEGLPIEFRRGRCPHRPASVTRGAMSGRPQGSPLRRVSR